jgi:hypothetical protein
MSTDKDDDRLFSFVVNIFMDECSSRSVVSSLCDALVHCPGDTVAEPGSLLLISKSSQPKASFCCKSA